MSSTNTIGIAGTLTRSRQGGSDYVHTLAHSLGDLTEVAVGDQVVASGELNTLLPDLPGGTSRMLFLSTTREVSISINGGAAITCASYLVILDTEVTSVAISNSGDSDAVVEWWLGS